MWLNISRIRNQRVWLAKNALELHQSSGRLGDEFADAMAFTDRESNYLADVINNDRMTRRIKKQFGW